MAPAEGAASMTSTRPTSARRWRSSSREQVWAVLDLLPMEEQADMFGYFERELQLELAQTAPRAKLARSSPR
jgi:Mg/Co/Ni transporter MgtE